MFIVQHKYYLQGDYRCEFETWNTKTVRRKKRQYPSKRKDKKGRSELDSITVIKADNWQIGP